MALCNFATVPLAVPEYSHTAQSCLMHEPAIHCQVGLHPAHDLLQM